MKIGIVGAAGKIGQMRVQNVLANPETELAAVLELDAERGRQVANGAPVFQDLDAFLATEMDAVIISTPAHVRAPIMLAAIERGLHILCEKPLTNRLDTAMQVFRAASDAGIVLGAGFNMRYYPAFAYVRDVLDQGLIGEIDHVRVYGGHSGLSNFTHDWEYRAEFSGGGALWDVGIHMTDMAHFVLGDIARIRGVTSNRVWQVPGSEDNALAIFESGAGIPAIYQATWNDWKGYKSAVEVYGTKGMVRGAYAPMETLLIIRDENGSVQRRHHNRFWRHQILERVKSWKITAVESFADELSDFIALTRGQAGLRIADAVAGVRAVEIATRLASPDNNGGTINLAELRA